jgi:small subunit ribosomal protein S16
MAVSIRLTRQGTNKKPFYRVIATDRRSPRDGRFIEQLGLFDPRAKKFSIDVDKYQNWVKNGAIPSDTVADLVKKHLRTLPPAPKAA